MAARNWDESLKVVDTLVASGTKAMSATLDNAAVVDAGTNKVTIPATAHGFASGSQLYLSGTTNYDGIRVLTAAATDTFTFALSGGYVAETLAGTETATITLAPGVAFEILEVRMHLNSNPTTAEYFTVTLDCNSGSAYDVVLYKHDFSDPPNTDLLWIPHRQNDFDPGDKLVFAWTNTDAVTWGLEVKYRRTARVGGRGIGDS
jgi:hypothetical protein